MAEITKKKHLSIILRIGLAVLVATFGIVLLYGGWIGVHAVIFTVGLGKTIRKTLIK